MLHTDDARMMLYRRLRKHAQTCVEAFESPASTAVPGSQCKAAASRTLDLALHKQP